MIKKIKISTKKCLKGCLLATSFVALFYIPSSYEKKYELEGTVRFCKGNEEKNYLISIDDGDNVWEYYSNTKIEKGTSVILEMSTNYTTDYIYDDIVVNVNIK